MEFIDITNESNEKELRDLSIGDFFISSDKEASQDIFIVFGEINEDGEIKVMELSDISNTSFMCCYDRVYKVSIEQVKYRICS